MGMLAFLRNAVRLAEQRLAAADNLRTHLRDAYRRGELVLVLGAGASASYGLPSWKDLLQALLMSVQNDAPDPSRRKERSDADSWTDVDRRELAELFNQVFQPEPLIAARYVRLSIDGEDESKPRGTRLEERIRDLLYARSLPEDFESELMKQIRQLCVTPRHSQPLDAIITYNYDDILERSLQRLGLIRFKTIYAIGMRSSSEELPIYHVHGYLPREGEITQDHRITLAEEEYHAQYMDIYSWKNMVQINKFRDRTCLFIGVSLTDPNQRRLLDIACKQRGDSQHRHVLVREKVRPADVAKRLDEIGRGAVPTEWPGTGVAHAAEGAKRARQHIQSIQSPSGAPGDRTADVAAQLAKLVHDFDEKDAESFGIGTIWVDDYAAEIPRILAEILESGTA